MDLTDALAAITSMNAAIASIGSALILAAAGVMTYKWVKAQFF